MESIDLSILKNYDAELIGEFLAPFAGQRIDIVIQKETDFSHICDPEEMDDLYPGFHIYREAAYIGQQLSFASRTFAYYVPCPTLMEPFRFFVDCSYIPALSQALSYIIEGHFFEETLANFDFHNNADEYYYSVINDEEYCDTMGLIQVATDFINGHFEVHSGDDEGDE